eukprot:scaffold534073_cov22-Prasinocladus_malaysianus.AAC.1
MYPTATFFQHSPPRCHPASLRVEVSVVVVRLLVVNGDDILQHRSTTHTSLIHGSNRMLFSRSGSSA